LDTVRLTITSSAGCSASKGSKAPRVAPPAPKINTRRPLSGQAKLCTKSRTKTHAVKVFGVDLAALELHRIHRPRHLRAGRQVGGIGKSIELEGRGHVHAPPARGPKRVHHFGETTHRGQQLGVDDVLPAHTGERGVNEGRLALFNGVANDGVTVGHEEDFKKILTLDLIVTQTRSDKVTLE
jgi:hypothetical protein